MTSPRCPSVLVAVSNSADRTAISAVSVELGYPTVSVAGGEAALSAFEDCGAGIVVVDLLSREVDGFDLCSRIREIAADQCAVIGLAQGERPGDLRRALAAGMDDVMPVPLRPEVIAARLLILERLIAARRAGRVADAEVARMRWLAGVGQTALTFQHEIGKPLTALYAHLETLERCDRLDGRDRLDVANAVEQARRIEAVVNHFMIQPRALPARLAGQAAR
jgi:CheY-like chemotaxis protein